DWSSDVCSSDLIWNNARIEHRLQEQEKLLLAAKIEALASQINPHFLFNTLASISSLIRTQPETARMLITKLSGLLRRLMRSTDHFVTLREELESIDEYLDIEVVRFGPQLKVVKDISAETLDVIVPSMLLQPLVENSIKHGLARKVGGGRITIRTRVAEGHTVIEVHDDGLGMTEERLEKAMGGGSGLSNGIEALTTIERLQPDVVFLDVQMPGLTGFEVARRMLDARASSHIIFVTAYDQHAIEAFEVNAVDYLLKPVDQARLEVAVERARRRVGTDRTSARGAGGSLNEQLEKIVQLVAERLSRRE